MTDLELQKLKEDAELAASLKGAEERYRQALAQQKKAEIEAKNEAAIPALQAELETELSDFAEVKQASDNKIRELILHLELEISNQRKLAARAGRITGEVAHKLASAIFWARHPDYERPSGQVNEEIRYKMREVGEEVNSLKQEVVSKLNSILPGTDALMVWKLTGRETEVTNRLLDVVGQYSGNQFLKPTQQTLPTKTNGSIQPLEADNQKIVSQAEFQKLWTKPSS